MTQIVYHSNYNKGIKHRGIVLPLLYWWVLL